MEGKYNYPQETQQEFHMLEIATWEEVIFLLMFYVCQLSRSISCQSQK